MVFIGTKHDGLGHRVSGTQIAAHLMGHLTDAVFDDDTVIVIGVVIDAVFYLVAIDVALSFGRAPLVANISGNVDDLERCQETIVNTLFKAVFIEWFAKVGDVRLVAGLLGRGCHT